MMIRYNINNFKMQTYFDATKEFATSERTPRAFLEDCLEQIDARESEIKAFVTIQPEKARQLADESSQRWANNQQLSAIDGMPIGIKDLLETSDMPTEMGCEA